MTCPFCNRPVDPADPRVFQRVIGWERNATRAGTRKGGGSDVSLREHLEEFAHPECVTATKHGVHVDQLTIA